MCRTHVGEYHRLHRRFPLGVHPVLAEITPPRGEIHNSRGDIFSTDNQGGIYPGGGCERYFKRCSTHADSSGEYVVDEVNEQPTQRAQSWS